jgi:hypothetical protein
VPTPSSRRHYKLDFTDTHLLSAHDIVWKICSVFQISPEQTLTLKVARIDFTADTSGTPVQWFKEHCRVLKKRGSEDYESVKTATNRGITTITFGKSPDLYRIYNRIAEKRERKEEVLYPGMHTGAPVPVITRIERECRGRKIPAEVHTLSRLFDNAEDFDPFQNLVLTPGGRSSATDDWDPKRWLMNLGLAYAVQQLGEAAVRSRLNRDRNAHRFFPKYTELLQAGLPGPTREHLRNSYRNSTVLQLNQPRPGPDGELVYPAGGPVWTL